MADDLAVEDAGVEVGFDAGDVVSLGEAFDGHEPGVVAGLGVFRTGVAQADDELHEGPFTGSITLALPRPLLVRHSPIVSGEGPHADLPAELRLRGRKDSHGGWAMRIVV